jgi:serine/threonine protein kinase
MEFSCKRNEFADIGPLCVGVLPLGENRCMADRVGQILGNYQLLRLLGRGAFAEVYLAEHRYLEIPAAIKVLHVRMEPHTHEHFLHEARTIAHLQHPHIVRVLDFGFQDQTPYLVMEYTPNGTLRTRHPKGTRLPLEQIVHYVKQIAPALDYAHQQRVIHRDVKPENMLLSANNEVVLSDFGIAVVQQSRDSLSSQSQAGTPLYMAPEQIQRKPCAASDQYALGVLVYEWLCGEPPFVGFLFEVLSQHLHKPPPSLCAHIPDLPQAVEDAVLGALAKEPHARFVSVQDFADVLEEVCEATQPLSLHLPSEHLSRDLISLPDIRLSPMPVPSPQEQDRSSSMMQALTPARKHTEDTEEPVALQVLPPASQTHIMSGHEKVAVSRTNRQRFLRKVRAFWITGVLEHSLHGATLLALGLQEQPDAVANPWQLVLQHPAGAPYPLPAGTRITQVYDAADGELLILGAPGSGKTTLLLELTRDLLDRAEQEEQHPLPVVFTLSSWATKQQPLADWLVEELTSTYQVPRKLGQAWVDADQILPLLDGLDEVAPKDRTACIESINAYRQEHGLLPLVVCSRSADYLAQTVRVRLSSAVTVQPLTDQQVDDYLARGGEPLRALRVALQQDADLRELTNTPLMLSILTLTYHGMPLEELVQGASFTDRQQQIFERYIERMLRHRGAAMPYAHEQTMHWLSWLARHLQQHNQTVFYIEHLQPTWLSGVRMRQAYDRWAVRFPAILMGVLLSLMIYSLLIIPPLIGLDLTVYIVLGGFIGWLLGAESTPQQPHERCGKARRDSRSRLIKRLRVGVYIGLSFGLVAGLSDLGRDLDIALSEVLSFGLSFGLGSILLQAALEKSNRAASNFQAAQRPRKPKWQHPLKHVGVRNGILIGLLLGLSYVLNSVLSEVLFVVMTWLSSALFYWRAIGLGDLPTEFLSYGLLLGLSGGFLSVLLIGKPVGITLTDELVWSWRSLGRSLLTKSHLSTTLGVTTLIGLSAAVFFGVSSLSSEALSSLVFRLPYQLNHGLSAGLSFWLVWGLLQGVSSETIGDQRRVVPNQGIRRSARNSLVFGLISTAIAWPIFTLSGMLSDVQNSVLFDPRDVGLSSALLIGLGAGVLAGLLNGGLACLRHGMLRLLLWRSRAIPWNYPRFLDYAAEHILLRKVGGSYIFVHRLLLEYFASLDSTPIHNEAGAQKQRVLPVS